MKPRALVLLALFLLTGPASANAARFHVNADAGPGGDGSTWSTAFRHLQDALDKTEAERGDEVWIAAGTYSPDQGTGVTEGNREESFVVKDSVSLFGGFAGDETDISQRDWEANRTILSGEIHEDREMWSYHVCHVTNGALDGVEVIRGNANGEDDQGKSGAVVVDGEITARNSVFSEHSAHTGAVSHEGDWVVSNSTFANNSATRGGVAYRGAWKVANSTFESNSVAGRAPYGAVAYEGTWNVTGSSFDNNSAEDRGGVAYRSTWTVTNSTFTRNSARRDLFHEGGGVAFEGNWTVTNCTFAENWAPRGGVAIWSTWTVTDSSFKDNSATFGGVAFEDNWTITESRFENNSADEGGVFYARELENGTWTVSDSVFQGNSAATGAVAYEGTWNVAGSRFEGNFNGPGRAPGGVAYRGSWNVANSSFSGNSSYRGGVAMSGTWSVTDSTFENNTASNRGGVAAESTWTVTHSTFAGNSSHQGGVARGGEWDVTSSTFESNSAGSSGGVAHLGAWIVRDSTVSDNSARSRGGVASGGTWTVTGSVFEGNSSTRGGVAASSTWDVTNSTFAGNSAPGTSFATGGGGVAHSSSWTVANCVFTGNTTDDLGGVTFGGVWEVTNSTFTGNSASEGSVARGSNFSGSWRAYNTIFADPGSFSNLWSFSNAEPGDVADAERAMNLIAGGTAGLPEDADIGSPDWILDTNPLFVAPGNPAGLDGVWGTEDDGLHLRAGSPAVAQGNAFFLPKDRHDLDNDANTGEPLPIDLTGASRVQGDGLNLGAYETAVDEAVAGDRLAAWQEDVFGENLLNPQISGLSADPDGDGISNLAEYALGGNPNIPDGSVLPMSGKVLVDDGEHLTLTFTRPGNRPDIDYAVLASNDLYEWHEGQVVLYSEEFHSDDTVTLVYRDTEPITKSSTRFLRLRITAGE